MGVDGGAFDLGSLAKKDSLVAGVRPTMRFVNVETEQGTVQLPVIQLEFKMVNGEIRKPVCMGPQMIMPLIAFLSQFAVTASGGVQMATEDGEPIQGQHDQGGTQGGVILG